MKEQPFKNNPLKECRRSFLSGKWLLMLPLLTILFLSSCVVAYPGYYPHHHYHHHYRHYGPPPPGHYRY
ncbi:hypothetical protein [Taibaiella soli]|uniref:Uncharacterized protein n=1 Tax=Taibaiella soli TaxID=1649169 RepID=A0A2W2B144_9BACT|nr:hypothetical protein [Taibaiella soli]PZF73964.1 hypothetical protein DN068_06400 [Taibaiella soli]